jgi:hypothetical protein
MFWVAGGLGEYDGEVLRSGDVSVCAWLAVAVPMAMSAGAAARTAPAAARRIHVVVVLVVI